MGLHRKYPSGSGYISDLQPNPNNWKIIQAEEISNYLLVRLNYPDCINFEGNKTLVFRDVTLIQLVNQKHIDPHFTENSQLIARFIPTDEGWQFARSFVVSLLNSGYTI